MSTFRSPSIPRKDDHNRHLPSAWEVPLEAQILSDCGPACGPSRGCLSTYSATRRLCRGPHSGGFTVYRIRRRARSTIW